MVVTSKFLIFNSQKDRMFANRGNMNKKQMESWNGTIFSYTHKCVIWTYFWEKGGSSTLAKSIQDIFYSLLNGPSDSRLLLVPDAICSGTWKEGRGLTERKVFSVSYFFLFYRPPLNKHQFQSLYSGCFWEIDPLSLPALQLV